MSNTNPESINIPAFMRKKGLDNRMKDKLLNTAYDYKQVGKLGKLAKEISRTRPLLRAKPRGLELETPIKRKHRKKSIPKKQQSFEIPSFDAPVVEETYAAPTYTSTYHPKTGVAKIIQIGTISDYLARIEVGIIELTDTVREGDIIQIECGDGMFQQPADSIQINRKQVRLAHKGASIGLKLVEVPEINGRVFKLA